MSNEKSLGFWSVVAIGIGGMVGGGIFAVLGLAVELSHGGTPVAFLIAGLVALITSYSYVKLSVKYPSQGGTVEFLNQSFGPGLTTGTLNILLFLSYIIMLSLYAYAFGSYGASFFPSEIQPFWRHIFTSIIIIVLTGLNILGARTVGRFEEAIVAFKISILLLFVSVGILSVNTQNLQPSTWSNTLSLIAGGIIIFVAYEGFELIANTAEDVKNPEKTLPRAYYFSVILVIILYILVALVTVGNLPLDQITAAKDYALAAAAKPFLGMTGFILIAVAALFSTGSAINATLYGTSRVSYIIAKEGELPEQLEKKIWNKPLEGLLITSLITLIVANLFDVSQIATMGSAGFLIIFAAVNASNINLHKSTDSSKYVSFTGLVVCIAALIALILQTLFKSPLDIWILIILLLSSFSIEFIYQKITGRKIQQIYDKAKKIF